MVAGRPARAERAGLRIDRVVAAVAITALTLSISIGGRMIADRIAGTNLSTLAGIRLLAPTDELVTFEDFELGAPGWNGGRTDQTVPLFGGMLGRFGGTDGSEAISRTYSIPAETAYALVSFDIHAIDDWALEDIIIFANGVEVLRQNFTTREDLVERQRSLLADLPWLRADLQPTDLSGTSRGFADGSPGNQDQSVTIRLVMAGPPAELRLGFGSTLESSDPASASWAVDNVQIVATETQPNLDP